MRKLRLREVKQCAPNLTASKQPRQGLHPGSLALKDCAHHHQAEIPEEEEVTTPKDDIRLTKKFIQVFL